MYMYVRDVYMFHAMFLAVHNIGMQCADWRLCNTICAIC